MGVLMGVLYGLAARQACGALTSRGRWTVKLDCFNAYFASFCVRSPQSKTGAANRPGPRPGRAGYRAAWDA